MSARRRVPRLSDHSDARSSSPLQFPRAATKAIRRSRFIKHLGDSRVDVESDLTFGERVSLWAPRRLIFGRNVRLGSDVRVEVDGIVGDHVLLANGSAIVGPRDHDATEVGRSIVESPWVGQLPERLSSVTVIGTDVWVGFGAIVLGGIEIGPSSIVAAGSVVTRDVPANSVVAGNPARVIRLRFSEEEITRHWALLDEQGLLVRNDQLRARYHERRQ